MDILKEFKSFITKEKLFGEKDKILLAVSGGVDSVVMCHLFAEAGYDFGIAHCNFGLRGKESDEDELFVKFIAKKYKKTFYTIRFETEKHAETKGISIQMAAREMRYEWFEKIRANKNYDFIAVAHHRDDEVETFFINLVRGTGIAGLHGILPKRNYIIRPILFAGKDDVKAYAKINKLKYREDSSNASDKYIRNKIRLKIFPALKELNPKISETIKEDMARLRDVEKIYQSAIRDKARKLLKKKNNKEFRINIAKLKELDPIQTWLYEFLSPFSFNEKTVEKITKGLDKISGKQFTSSTHQLLKDREELIISPIQQKEEFNQIEISEKTEHITIPVKINITRKTAEKFNIPNAASIACFDANKLKFPLILRKWEKGDFFYPLGLKGRKKISDFFIDNKISIHEKAKTFVLESDGEIIWLVGLRIDERFKITKTTKEVYRIEMVV